MWFLLNMVMFVALQRILCSEAFGRANFTNAPASPVYVSSGSDIILVWNHRGSGNYTLMWLFVSDQSKQLEYLGRKFGETTYNLGSNRISISGQATLVVRNTTMADSGVYKCLINFHNASDYVTSSVQVVIVVKPVALVSCSRSIVLKEGDDFYCWCDGVRGNPTPIVSWEKDGQMIGPEERLTTKLSVVNASCHHAGRYVCSVHSKTLKDIKTVDITVYCKPTVVVLTSDASLGTNTVVAGSNLVLNCSSNGYPLPTNSIIRNGRKLDGVIDGVVVIKKVKLNDEGPYYCIAENEFGKARSKDIFLNVKESQETLRGARVNLLLVIVPVVTSVVVLVCLILGVCYYMGKRARTRCDTSQTMGTEEVHLPQPIYAELYPMNYNSPDVERPRGIEEGHYEEVTVKDEGVAFVNQSLARPVLDNVTVDQEGERQGNEGKMEHVYQDLVRENGGRNDSHDYKTLCFR